MSTSLKYTPLHQLHLELGAKMAAFAGYQMPVNYPSGIIAEHLHTRQQAGLFDVSHMGQVRLSGANIAAALERLTPVDLLTLGDGKQKYALLTNDQGGIRDDLMISRLGDDFLLVVNAACKEQDLAYCRQHLDASIMMEVLDEQALLALQGPQAAAVLQRLGLELATMRFMALRSLSIGGLDCIVTRSGYSGEDGFEISIAADHATELATMLLADDTVKMVGLGARDSLRLEAGLCLYGQDLTTATTPLEADLGWAISPARRPDGARAGGYPGDSVIAAQYENGVTRLRVGLRPDGRAPIRAGAPLVDANGQSVGQVSSGGFAPSLGHPLAMGYVQSAYASVGTRLQAVVRNKARALRVAQLPFVKPNYYRGK